MIVEHELSSFLNLYFRGFKHIFNADNPFRAKYNKSGNLFIIVYKSALNYQGLQKYSDNENLLLDHIINFLEKEKYGYKYWDESDSKCFAELKKIKDIIIQ